MDWESLTDAAILRLLIERTSGGDVWVEHFRVSL
jgi:hypothetical protein